MFPNQPDFHDYNAGLDPEDIVPSALGDDPMASFDKDHPEHKKQHHFVDDMGTPKGRDMVVENDYAKAMRDMHRDSVSTPGRSSDSPNRSLPSG